MARIVVTLLVVIIVDIFPRYVSWTTPNLFENCSLRFITCTNIPECPSKYKTLRYFTQIRQSNPYSPRIFSQFIVNETHLWTRPMSSSLLAPYLGSNRITIIFIDLYKLSQHSERRWTGLMIYRYLHRQIVLYLSPVYLIFQNFLLPWTTVYYVKNLFITVEIAASIFYCKVPKSNIKYLHGM